MSRVMIFLIQGYQVALRPVFGGHCRFETSCSRYGIDAIQKHGAFKGGWLTLRRILRCQPWGGCGYDPVPLGNNPQITQIEK